MTRAPSLREGARLGACLALSFSIALLTACCHEQVATLSDSPVVVAGREGGGVLAGPHPAAGKALAAGLALDATCIPGERVLALLGQTCSHETENAGDAKPPSRDLPGGVPSATNEVRWYCDGRLAVRVVWAPCDANSDGKPDGITPIEVSVATHPGKE